MIPVDAGGAVSLRGPDARRFCNGMFTNNVRDLPVGGVQRSALLDDRGRVLGLLWFACTGPDTFLALPDGGASAGFTERFASFLVFDDVEVAPLGLAHAWHVAGPTAADGLAAAGLPAPGGVAEVPGGWVLPTDRVGVPGWDVWGPAPVEPVATEAEATRLRVRAGRVVWPDDVGEKRLVHELGLRDHVLSFAKGCYVGQETVNRVDVMGGVKRRLTGIVLERSARPGAPVTVAGEVVGAVTSVAGDLALAVLKIPADTPGTAVEVEGVAGVTSGFPIDRP